MKIIKIEIEGEKRSLNEPQKKVLAERLESTLVWFGMQNIKIVSIEENELSKKNKKPLSEPEA